MANAQMVIPDPASSGLGQFIVPVLPAEMNAPSAAPNVYVGPAVPVAPPPAVNRTTTLVIAVLTFLLIMVIVCLWRTGGTVRGQLENAGWVLYTKPGCPYCVRQMETLGGSYRNKVTCGAASSDPAGCAAAPGYPHWVNSITGKTVSGYQSQAGLKAMLN
jgi:hypothetical protein